MRNGRLPYSTGRKPWRSEPPPELTPDAPASKQKVLLFGVVVILVFGILTAQLARMQLINGAEYRLRAETNRLRHTALLPPRGLVYDRNGLPLVENRASFAAAVVAADIPICRACASSSSRGATTPNRYCFRTSSASSAASTRRSTDALRAPVIS
jgi:hypothetical protein